MSFLRLKCQRPFFLFITKIKFYYIYIPTFNITVHLGDIFIFHAEQIQFPKEKNEVIITIIIDSGFGGREHWVWIRIPWMPCNFWVNEYCCCCVNGQQILLKWKLSPRFLFVSNDVIQRFKNFTELFKFLQDVLKETMSQELKMDVKVGTGPAGKQKRANGNVLRNKRK